MTQQQTQTIDNLVQDHNALANMTDAQLEAMLGQEDGAEGDTASGEAPASTHDNKADGVATKDGKNIIPFAVLDATRANLTKAEERAQAENAARLEAESKLAEIEAQLEALKSGNSLSNQADMLSDDELAELESEMPTLGAKLREQQAQIVALNEKLASQSEVTDAIKAESLLTTVQLAIDATPKLAFLQAQSADAFNAAKRIDKTLRADPEFANLTLTERFEKVVERYEEAYGAIKLSSKTEIDLKNATTKALEEADAKNTAPISMSDIPGGTPPAVDELAAIGDKSGVELEQMFAKMTPKQIEDYLNRF